MNDDSEIENNNINEDIELEKVLRPKKFIDFEGQDQIVENLDVFISAAKKRRGFGSCLITWTPRLR